MNSRLVIESGELEMNQKTVIQTFALFLTLAGIVAAMPFLWSLSARINASSVDSSHAGLEVGAALPELTGVGWLNGDGPKSGDLAGKVVVVHAFADFCPKCHRGMPNLVELQHKYKERGVVFVGITTDGHERQEADAQSEQISALKRYLKKYGADWPIAYGAIECLTAFKAEYIPGYWVIGRDGKVVYNKASTITMDEAIDAALNEPTTKSDA